MPPQWHCPLSSSSSSKKTKDCGSLNYLNFEYVTPACKANNQSWTVACCCSQQPLCVNKRPYLPRYRRTMSLVSTSTHIVLAIPTPSTNVQFATIWRVQKVFLTIKKKVASQYGACIFPTRLVWTNSLIIVHLWSNDCTVQWQMSCSDCCRPVAAKQTAHQPDSNAKVRHLPKNVLL
jgi:hypothetical protein